MSPTPTKLKKGFHVIGNHDKMYKPCWMSLVKKNDDYKKLNACPRHDLHDKLKLKNSNLRSWIFFLYDRGTLVHHPFNYAKKLPFHFSNTTKDL